MSDGTSALLFLYGLFWAEMLATSARYKGFPTGSIWAEWSNVEKRKKRLRRMGMSLLLLNLFPIVWLGVLYEWVVPKESSVKAVAMAALASLSTFGILRVYHAIVASSEMIDKFYPEEDKTRDPDIQAGDGLRPMWAHFGPGVIYLLGYTLLAIILGKTWDLILE